MYRLHDAHKEQSHRVDNPKRQDFQIRGREEEEEEESIEYLIRVVRASAHDALASPVTPGCTRETSIASETTSMTTGDEVIGREMEMYRCIGMNANLISEETR